MIYDVAIIGGGPAGLTAGIYAARKKLKAVIFSEKTGGQAILAEIIENFPGIEKISGQELTEKMKEQNEKYGVEIRKGEEVKLIKRQVGEFNLEASLPSRSDASIKTRAVIIATGKNPQHLNIPGEKEFESKGISFCSTCDAPLFGGKKVAVVGSGNSGLCSARDLSKYASQIYVLEYAPKIMGDEWMVEELKKTGKVEFIISAKIKEIKGTKFVESIVYNDGEELAVDGIFINIGWTPATGFVKGFLDLNSDGEIIIDPKTNQTSVPGVFAAGDATDIKYKQCVIAAGEGAKAALSAYNYLAKI